MNENKVMKKKIGDTVVRCAILYHLFNLKNVKNTHGGVKLQALFLALQVNTWQLRKQY